VPPRAGNPIGPDERPAKDRARIVDGRQRLKWSMAVRDVTAKSAANGGQRFVRILPVADRDAD
jgi:hypothetical protein